jgi:hypothetical protein
VAQQQTVVSCQSASDPSGRPVWTGTLSCGCAFTKPKRGDAPIRAKCDKHPVKVEGAGGENRPDPTMIGVPSKTATDLIQAENTTTPIIPTSSTETPTEIPPVRPSIQSEAEASCRLDGETQIVPIPCPQCSSPADLVDAAENVWMCPNEHVWREPKFAYKDAFNSVQGGPLVEIPPMDPKDFVPLQAVVDAEEFTIGVGTTETIEPPPGEPVFQTDDCKAWIESVPATLVPPSPEIVDSFLAANPPTEAEMNPPPVESVTAFPTDAYGQPILDRAALNRGFEGWFKTRGE